MQTKYLPMLRHPRTTQERKYNEDEDHKKFTRGRRRNLPTAWDDIFVRRKKNWKALRKTKYRSNKEGWRKRVHNFSGPINDRYQILWRLYDCCEKIGCWFDHDWINDRFIWYGPDFLGEDR